MTEFANPADQMAALGDATRRSIVEILAIQPHSVADIASRLPVSRPAVSQHLRVLKDVGLVTVVSEGTRNIYQLDPKGIAALRDHLDSLWQTALEQFKTKAEQLSPQTKGEFQMNNADNAPAQVIVRKSVLVNTSQEHAFTVFTKHIGTWWPLVTHHIGASPAQTTIVEGAVGGRWYERSSDGVEADWGRVLVWEPPHRVVLSWDIGPTWKYDPELGTEVDVRFISEGPNATRVELEHRHLERYGNAAEMMRATFESEHGWDCILRGFTKATEKA